MKLIEAQLAGMSAALRAGKTDKLREQHKKLDQLKKVSLEN
jgi:hypothetical protein